MPEDHLIVRLAAQADCDEIAQLAINCFPLDYKKGNSESADQSIAKEWWRKRINLFPYALTFVVKNIDSDEVVGFAYFMMIGGLSGVVQLEIIGVHEEYRKKGLASRLITEAAEMVNTHLLSKFNVKLFKIMLTTSSDNPVSHTVYKKLGFELIGDLGVLFFQHKEVVYTKEFTQDPQS